MSAPALARPDEQSTPAERQRWWAPRRGPAREQATLAYYVGLLTVAVTLADATLYPQDRLDSGGLKLAGGRVEDELALVVLLLSVGPLLTGRLRVPASLGLPFFLASCVWAWGGVIGIGNHAAAKELFAECHLLLDVGALCLAWLQAPARLVRRHELLLMPIALLGVLVVLPSHAMEKGGDLSTMSAGVASVILVRHRLWLGLPLAVASAALIVTGNQRAAILFSLPPLLVSLVVALHGRRATRWGAAAAGVAIVGIGAAVPRIQGPLGHQLAKTFHSQSKIGASDSRRTQFDAGLHHVHESPWFGHGLGYVYQYSDQVTGNASAVASPITHNVYLDLTLRFGLVGLAVLGLILVAGLVRVVQLWDRLTPLRIVLVLTILGLLVHAGVESIFDKPRLTVFAGWILAELLCSPGPGEEVASPRSRRRLRTWWRRRTPRPSVAT